MRVLADDYFFEEVEDDYEAGNYCCGGTHLSSGEDSNSISLDDYREDYCSTNINH